MLAVSHPGSNARPLLDFHPRPSRAGDHRVDQPPPGFLSVAFLVLASVSTYRLAMLITGSLFVATTAAALFLMSAPMQVFAAGDPDPLLLGVSNVERGRNCG